MTKLSNTRAARVLADQKMIAGVQAFLAKSASLTVGSQVVTPADIVKLLQDRIDASTAAESADTARAAAVKAERDERAKTAAFVRSFRRVVVGMFEQTPDTLAAFGFTAPKVAKKSAETKATAAKKSTATRKAHEAALKAPAETPAKPTLG